jgi:2-dehydro-3-deoxyphosphooctonate aldolase (KDO 8-P synthase)
LDFYFKASYRKANRSSIKSFEGIGDEKALDIIKNAAERYHLTTLTDFHTAQEAEIVSNYVDVLQIPAFLARQTDIITAAAKTGKIVNIKKGQFMAPDDMKKAVEKVKAFSENDIWLTERGTFFGYHDLVVDMRSITRMKTIGYPVIYDATHSVQQPSIGEQSGGLKEYILPLAKAAISSGADGIFFETHPDPINAKSDSATQLDLRNARNFIESILELFNFINK